MNYFIKIVFAFCVMVPYNSIGQLLSNEFSIDLLSTKEVEYCYPQDNLESVSNSYRYVYDISPSFRSNRENYKLIKSCWEVYSYRADGSLGSGYPRKNCQRGDVYVEISIDKQITGEEVYNCYIVYNDNSREDSWLTYTPENGYVSVTLHGQYYMKNGQEKKLVFSTGLTIESNLSFHQIALVTSKYISADHFLFQNKSDEYSYPAECDRLGFDNVVSAFKQNGLLSPLVKYEQPK